MDKQTGAGGVQAGREPDFRTTADGVQCRHARLTRINDATSLDVSLRCDCCGEVRKVDGQVLLYQGERAAWDLSAPAVKATTEQVSAPFAPAGLAATFAAASMGRACLTCAHVGVPIGLDPCAGCIFVPGLPHWRPETGAVLRPVRVETSAKPKPGTIERVDGGLLSITMERTDGPITPTPETPGAFGAILAGVDMQADGLLTVRLTNVSPGLLDAARPGAWVELRKLARDGGAA